MLLGSREKPAYFPPFLTAEKYRLFTCLLPILYKELTDRWKLLYFIVSPPFLVSLFILFDCLLISEVAISVES
jgi:hypothetical protein